MGVIHFGLCENSISAKRGVVAHFVNRTSTVGINVGGRRKERGSKSNMKHMDKAKISYEPEADVLTWELSGQKIHSAQEMGNVVVHFTKKDQPVLVEILEASRFLSKANALSKKDCP